MRSARWVLMAAALVVAGLLAGPGSAAPAREAAAGVEGPELDVRVMTFNIWLGGHQVNYGRVVDAIRAADADIVLLQEAEGETRALADAAGLPYASPELHVISRYPLFDAPGADPAYVLAEVRPGRFVAVADIHLTSDPYGPVRGSGRQDGAADPEARAGDAAARDQGVHPDAHSRGNTRDARRDRRRLQRPLAPRLDAGHRREPPARSLPDRVAGELGARKGRLPGQLPGGAPRLGRRPRDHLDVGLSVSAPRAERGRRPDRPDPRRRAGDDRVELARRPAGRPGRGYADLALALRSPRRRLDPSAGGRPRALDGVVRPARRSARRGRRRALPCCVDVGRSARERPDRHRPAWCCAGRSADDARDERPATAARSSRSGRPGSRRAPTRPSS